MSGRFAVFLDRDGVIDEPVMDPVDAVPEAPVRASDVRLVAGAAPALRRLQAAGALLIVVSNQPAAAKGKATCDGLRAVHHRVVELLADESVAIDDWRYCAHHPRGVVAALTGTCRCRKPSPGMLLDALADNGLEAGRCWMVGDSDVDIEAGQAAGVRTILLDHPSSTHRRRGSARPDETACDLAAAADRIMAAGTDR